MASTVLDKLYGKCELPGKPVAPHEISLRPLSHMTLTDETAPLLKAYMDRTMPLKLVHPFAQTNHILWLIDEAGDIQFAVEEVVDPNGTLVGVLPRATIARPKKYKKLGHPTLLPLGQTKARIGGEIIYDPIDQGGPEWCLTNESGRFGFRQGQTEAHLKAACGLFGKFHLYLSYEYYPPVH